MTSTHDPEITASPARPPVDVAIIGAGASAALLVTALRRSPPGTGRVAVVGHRHPPGRGVAYSTADPGHLMNVPARRLGLDSADPDGLVRWLQHRGGPHQGPEAYIPRVLYGDHVAECPGPIPRCGDGPPPPCPPPWPSTPRPPFAAT